MSRYLDTSLLIPLYVEESRSEDAERWLVDLDKATLFVSP